MLRPATSSSLVVAVASLGGVHGLGLGFTRSGFWIHRNPAIEGGRGGGGTVLDGGGSGGSGLGGAW